MSTSCTARWQNVIVWNLPYILSLFVASIFKRIMVVLRMLPAMLSSIPGYEVSRSIGLILTCRCCSGRGSGGSFFRDNLHGHTAAALFVVCRKFIWRDVFAVRVCPHQKQFLAALMEEHILRVSVYSSFYAGMRGFVYVILILPHSNVCSHCRHS